MARWWCFLGGEDFLKNGWFAKSKTYIIDGVSCEFDKNGYCITE